MNKVFALLLLGIYAFSANAQNPVYQDEAYGKVDIADLQLTSSDFESADAAPLPVVAKFRLFGYFYPAAAKQHITKSK